MTKMFFSVICTTLVTILIIMSMAMNAKKHRFGGVFRNLLWLSIGMGIVYNVSLFIHDFRILVVLHCTIQVLQTWIMYVFLAFTVAYTEVEKNTSRLLKSAIRILCCLDCVLLIVNFWGNRWFSFQDTNQEMQDVYLGIKFNAISWVHFCFLLLLDVIIIYLLLRKAVRETKVYKGKYLYIAEAFFAGTIVLVVLRLLGGYIMFVSVVKVAVSVMVIYCVYFCIPKLRLMKMNNFAIEKMSTPVLMFDYDDELRIWNTASMDILNVTPHMSMQEFVSSNNLRHILTPERRKQGKTQEFSMSTQHNNQTFMIHGQELKDELGRFVGTLLIYTDISGQEKLKDEATFYATRDSLTGAWSREYFFEMVSKTINENPKKEYVMIASDIYQFKMFNDILGISTGNDLLLTISRGLEQNVHRGWIFSRISADRFALFMPQEDFDEKSFLQKTNAAIEQRGYALRVHFYIGVYKNVDTKLQAHSIYDRAYMALESIKGSMERQIAYYDEEIRSKRLYEALTIDELTYALEAEQFSIYFQPQMDSFSGKVVGAEALVRWMSPKRGVISPCEFIPLFEANGMIAKLDYHVWELACKQIKEWNEQGYFNRSISVNISAKDFYLMDVYESICRLVEKYNISPKYLKLEITETAFVIEVKEQIKLVKRLREKGFIVSIDDFGSGYSSLNSLKDISVELIKLDMKFFEETKDKERAKTIIESVVRLAYNLKMSVIAEGVETEENVKMLQEMGCGLVQGYYYSQPLNKTDFEAYMERHGCIDFCEIIEKAKK